MAKKRIHRPQGSRPLPPEERARRSRPGVPAEHVESRSLGARLRDTVRGAPERLHDLPTWALPLGLVVMAVLGFYVDSRWAGIFLLGVAAVLGWLAADTWHTLSTGGRVLRVFVVVAMAALGVLKLVAGGL